MRLFNPDETTPPPELTNQPQPANELGELAESLLDLHAQQLEAIQKATATIAGVMARLNPPTDPTQ